MPLYLGIDTSNYTTSVALFDSVGGQFIHRRLLLPVPKGERGIRQANAVFLHTMQLPQLIAELADGRGMTLSAIGVSDAPSRIEGSYMPCFMVGVGLASSLSYVNRIPLYRFSHQEGHIMAALISAKRMDVLQRPFYAFHASGGTTELVHVKPGDKKSAMQIARIGGKQDICAGQLIDRVGVMLGLSFPCGQEMDKLSLGGVENWPRVSVKDGWCNLSGFENKAKAMLDMGARKEDCARFCIDAVAATIDKMISDCVGTDTQTPFVFTGGVMSNTLLREFFGKRPNAIFAQPSLSTDNAVGTAVLASLAQSDWTKEKA
jgi:N6-L-threonylcarbamoyladenine synthase